MRLIMPPLTVLSLVIFAVFAGVANGPIAAGETVEHTVALGGNAYRTQGDAGGVSPAGIRGWDDPESVFSVFVASDETAQAEVTLRARAASGEGELALEANGARKTGEVSSAEYTTVAFGEYELRGGAYTEFTLEMAGDATDLTAEVSDLVITTPEDVELTYVKDNQNNRYYWGRRGPSVHLRYADIPENTNIEWFYSEITVPEGEDPVGSFYMANGFGQGYFGFQVNSPTERRVLFSVWSPYVTDDPGEIPEDQRVETLDSGEDVYTGDFGGEGSGGQSFLRYGWETGKTYGFLNGVRPDGEGGSIYTAYFLSPDEEEWKLIARFRRPQTDTWYTGAHSFLESFSANNGHQGRQALYHNQWARDVDGEWHEVTEAVFTGDNIAQLGYRADFSGGEREEGFYLRNCGFFVGETPLGSRFSRPALGDEPNIDPSQLEYM